MSGDWGKENRLEDKLFTPIIKDVIVELAKSKEVPTITEFMFRTHRAYSQIHKIRNYLALKGLVKIEKNGKDTKTKLTPKGEKVATALWKFIELINKVEGE